MFSQKSQSFLVIVILFFCFFANASYFTYLNGNPTEDADEFVGNTDDPLYLTPLIREGKFDEAKQLAEVKNNDMNQIAKSYSGYLTVNETFNSNLFFWYFPAKENPQNAPVVLWLQGGPGFTSLYGLFFLNGPFIIDNGTLLAREYSWHKDHHLIYIDNPVGVGLSFTDNDADYARDENDVARNLYEGIKQFFTLFSELQSNKFYVTGQSYAGKYCPALAYKIYKDNKNDEPKINLAGLAIGNGLSDPVNQMEYGEILYQIGLIDLSTLVQFQIEQNKAIALINDEQYVKAIRVVGRFINSQNSIFANATGLTTNLNYLAPKNYGNSDGLEEFINSSVIRDAIHVGNKSFTVSSKKVRNFMENDIMASVKPWIIELLTHYPIYLYSGQLDIIVASALTENYLLKLEFNEAAEFRKKKRAIWYVDKEVAGYHRQAGNLTEYIIRNAGHCVPSDQPKWAYTMLKFLTHG